MARPELLDKEVSEALLDNNEIEMKDFYQESVEDIEEKTEEKQK